MLFLRSFLRASGASLLLLAVGACASPDTPFSHSLNGDVALGGGIATGPAAGFMLGASQRVVESSTVDAHIEIEVHDQALDPIEYEGERLDGSWSQVRGGVKLVWPTDDEWAWTGRMGITWVRAVGDPVFVDVPEDFGGFYLSAGRDRLLGRHLLFSPDLALLGLFEESEGDTGIGVQLTLRFYWLP